MSEGYEYLLEASKHANGNGEIWFRYLYKVIQDDGTKLTPTDVELLLNDPNLLPFEKVTLQDALTEGTHTREHVLSANRKTKPKDILKLFREGKYGNISKKDKDE